VARTLYWIAPVPTPYLDYLWRHVTKAIPSTTVVLKNHASGGHPWKSKMGEGYRTVCADKKGFDWSIVRLAKDRDAFFVFAGWQSFTFIALLSLLRILGRDYILWTDTPNPVRSGSWLKEKLRSAWVRWIFAGARAVLSTGRPGVEGMKRYGAPPDRVASFPFFLDLDAYPTRPADAPPPATIRMVSSGRIIHRVKGHDLAVRALAAALKDTPVDCEYCIAGTGPDEQALIALSKELGVERQVKCLGWTEPDDLRRLMCESHVLVHPSPIADPFPNAVLEAMAAGMVVLGSDVCGSVVDRVEEGTSGFVHKAGDVDGLAEHMRTIFRQRGRLPAMGAAARKTAEAWPVERGVAKIVDLYEGRFPPVH